VVESSALAMDDLHVLFDFDFTGLLHCKCVLFVKEIVKISALISILDMVEWRCPRLLACFDHSSVFRNRS
jgi:hypothetical protein